MNSSLSIKARCAEDFDDNFFAVDCDVCDS